MQYDQTVPDYLRANAPAPELTAGIAQARGPHITIRNGQFLKVDTAGVEANCTQFHPQLGPYVDIVVVAGSAGLAKVFYETAYDPNSPDFPTCFSNDGKFPDAGSTTVQAPSCAQCPQNVFGSLITPTGGRAKACSDRKRLAVLLLTEFTADMRSGPIYEFSVSPSNLRAWNEFVTTLIGRGVPPDGIVMRISPDPQKQGGMLFNAAVDPSTNSGVWFIPKWAYDLSLVARESEEAKRAIGFYANPAAPALTAPPAQTALPAPAPGVEGSPLPAQPTGFAAPAAAVPAAPPSNPAFAAQPGFPAGGAATSVSTNGAQTNEAPARRPRRTKAEMEAARAAQNNPRPAPRAVQPNAFGSPNGGAATASPSNGAAPAFGVHTAASAPAVDPELDKMLGDVMGRPAQ